MFSKQLNCEPSPCILVCMLFSLNVFCPSPFLLPHFLKPKFFHTDRSKTRCSTHIFTELQNFSAEDDGHAWANANCSSHVPPSTLLHCSIDLSLETFICPQQYQDTFFFYRNLILKLTIQLNPYNQKHRLK